jgi:3-isopropylmalate dehydrogenase
MSVNDGLTLSGMIPGWTSPSGEKTKCTIGVLPGEGIGPEIIEVSLNVLNAVTRGTPVQFTVDKGGDIGLAAQQKTGQVLTKEVVSFVESVFSGGGAMLCGPGGGRFVYELRSEFDLFCKVTPIQPLPALLDVGVVKTDSLNDVDILIVRENAGGIYFGRWEETQGADGLTASHTFEYREDQVDRILYVAVALASGRRRRLSLVLKPDGIPSISRLWTEVFKSVVKDSGLESQILQVDYAAYHLIHAARDFDVIVCPNLFGDILSDLGGLLMGSRGMCFSGNFGKDGRAVYQTGHGAAYDLSGRNQANPIGQLCSLAMLLRVSFGQQGLARRIEAAMEKVLREGWRTPDIVSPGCRVIGTRELGDRIVEAIEALNEVRAA